LILLSLLLLSLLGAILFVIRLWNSLRQTAYLLPAPSESVSDLPFISVLIPAYNEAENIEACVQSVLESTSLSADRLEVWVIDDQSTDGTAAIVQLLQKSRNDPRLKLLNGKSRPVNEIWMGKNWACVQGVEQAAGAFLLFMDADVRLKSGTIEAAVQTAEQEQIDLLTCGPAIVCGCLAEWLVQPLMFSTILIGFSAEQVNDPTTETAFAAGPFMLFRRSAYESIGGHRAVADQVVEDVELAKRVKRSGLKLQLRSGIQLISLRMYRSWAALWEGWTKNLFLASNRNFLSSLLFAALMPLIFTVPWLVLLSILMKAIWIPLQTDERIAIVLASIAISIHFLIRKLIAHFGSLSTQYWWLSGVGGILISAITLASIIKTETGWGWTWRGRSLKAAIPSDLQN
jgi:cellulose synthase/poly-beta-1,6-N-acetylglucosamine synthase-like glycosyltransferase